MNYFLKDYLILSVSSYIFYLINRGGLTSRLNKHIVLVSTPTYLRRLFSFLQLDMNCAFKLFSDLVGSDFPHKFNRFQLIYNLLSIQFGNRVLVTCWSVELEKVPTVVSLYPSSSWYEREVWDMYGIHFEEHYDLRRILSDYGFQGHPLRKDFPLSGFVELYYDDRFNSIVYQPVSLVQSYRFFDTQSPWEWIPLD